MMRRECHYVAVALVNLNQPVPKVYVQCIKIYGPFLSVETFPYQERRYKTRIKKAFNF